MCIILYGRTLNGMGILVCSMDGTVAFLDFSLDELGDPLNEEEKVCLEYSTQCCIISDYLLQFRHVYLIQRQDM